MTAIHDGPSSPHFTPLPLTGNIYLSDLANSGKMAMPPNITVKPNGMSRELVDAISFAPNGSNVSWGIPFEISKVVMLSEHPVSCEIDPTQARWLVFLHTSDVRPLQPGKGGIISPLRGSGQLAEHAADYVICYLDGSETRAAIRRRYQL